MEHLNEFEDLWERYVPARGQADTQQGEVIRAVEKLRHETVDNANINWRAGHDHLVAYLRRTLLSAACFTGDQRSQIKRDLEEVADKEDVSTPAELFDRLLDRAVEWVQANPDPIPHEHVPDLGL
jgi:hypothetical protein